MQDSRSLPSPVKSPSKHVNSVQVIMVPQVVTKTIMQPAQVTQSVMEPRQVTSTVVEDGKVSDLASPHQSGPFFNKIDRWLLSGGNLNYDDLWTKASDTNHTPAEAYTRNHNGSSASDEFWGLLSGGKEPVTLQEGGHLAKVDVFLWQKLMFFCTAAPCRATRQGLIQPSQQSTSGMMLGSQGRLSWYRVVLSTPWLCRNLLSRLSLVQMARCCPEQFT